MATSHRPGCRWFDLVCGFPKMELGLDRRTVRKYACICTWREVMRRPPRKPSTLDPYRDYLQ